MGVSFVDISSDIQSLDDTPQSLAADFHHIKKTNKKQPGYSSQNTITPLAQHVTGLKLTQQFCASTKQNHCSKPQFMELFYPLRMGQYTEKFTCADRCSKIKLPGTEQSYCAFIVHGETQYSTKK